MTENGPPFRSETRIYEDFTISDWPVFGTGERAAAPETAETRRFSQKLTQPKHWHGRCNPQPDFIVGALRQIEMIASAAPTGNGNQETARV
ncbi:MAG: hypothetical protein V4441_07905 [Pseudomonadota bacterium]